MGYFSLLFGVLTIIGGIMGYQSAGSMASLISGSAFGVLLIVCALALMKNKPFGYYGLLLLSLLLGGWFLNKYLATGALMPAGLMVGLSGINLIGLLLQSRQSPKADAL